MLPSSAFRSLSVCPPLERLTLADLHLVSTITAEHWASYAASVLRSTRWQYRAPFLGKVASEFPSSNRWCGSNP